MRLDELDLRIVALLQEDARLSFREIAERTGSTTPTVSARVKALEDIGLLRGYRAQLDHSVLGGTSYVVTLTLQPQAARAALEAVKAMPGVHSVHLLSGGRVVAHVHLRPPALTLARLDQTVAQLPGLITYDASEVIEGHEHASAESLPETVEVPCHQCKGPIHGDPVKGKFGERTHVFCCRQCLGSFRERFEAAQEAAAASGPKLPKKLLPR
ncbi:MAG TPA: AsnC family transcriptional regulator [Candidatus Thermoplasmatota archaeon]|nr:AsnC family transcriptional regulator [Candidatus Thermoplasmatota archaeon]